MEIKLMPRTRLASCEFARPPRRVDVEGSPWFIGIDQSSTNNGLAAYHTGLNTVYTTNFLCGKNNVELLDRLYRLEHFIEKLIQEAPPKCVYTEEIHPGNRHAYAVLLRVEVVIHAALYRNYVPFSSIGANVAQRTSWPAQLKIGGSKEHIKLALSGIADPLCTEHELDAIGVLMGSMVRDKFFEVDLLQSIKIKRVEDCNEYINQLRELSTN